MKAYLIDNQQVIAVDCMCSVFRE